MYCNKVLLSVVGVTNVLFACHMVTQFSSAVTPIMSLPPVMHIIEKIERASTFCGLLYYARWLYWTLRIVQVWVYMTFRLYSEVLYTVILFITLYILNIDTFFSVY